MNNCQIYLSHFFRCLKKTLENDGKTDQNWNLPWNIIVFLIYYLLILIIQARFSRRSMSVNSLMWDCVGECLAHILRHRACTERLMDDVSSISHFIRSVFLEVGGTRTPTVHHPCIISNLCATPEIRKTACIMYVKYRLTVKELYKKIYFCIIHSGRGVPLKLCEWILPNFYYKMNEFFF